MFYINLRFKVFYQLNYVIVILLFILSSIHKSLTTVAEIRVRSFPDNFKLGIATSAYQIEGAWNVDGKGPNVWDTFAHDFPGKIYNRSNGDVAVDSYHLYKEDVALLKSVGAQFYRFSFSWSRILPTGEISSLNKHGVAYYHRLIDELIDNGIEPFGTMFHWDLPQYLQNLGGFANPLIIDYFVSYANLLFKEYGGKIKQWITFSEPLEVCDSGYQGQIPPAIIASGVGEYICAHHLIQAHARTYHLYKNDYYYIQEGLVGIVLDLVYALPKDSHDEEDVKAADRSIQFDLGLYANPIFSSEGDYPEIVRQIVDKNSVDEGREWSRLPKFSSEMVEYVRGTADFFGINYYTSQFVKSVSPDDYISPSKNRDKYVQLFFDKSWPRAKSSWIFSVPEGFRSLLNWIKINYGDYPIIICENGWSDDGELEDHNRIIQLNSHMNVVLDAIDDEVNIIGYTIWTLIDSFEWLMGYTEKFGIVRVDQNDPNLTRIKKKSFSYVQEVFTTRQIVDEN